MIVSLPSWDALPTDTKQAMRAAGAKLQRRMEFVGRDVNRVVLSGTLTGHGIHAATVPPATRAAFFNAARATRPHAAVEEQVPADALQWVLRELGIK